MRFHRALLPTTLTVATTSIALWDGCRNAVQPPPSEKGRTEHRLLTETTAEFYPAYDAWVARKDTLDCSQRPCIDAVVVRHAGCSQLVLQKPRTGWCTSSALRLDFETGSLPDCAIVTLVTLNLYWRNGSRDESYDLLDISSCSQDSLSEPQNSLALTSFYRAISTAGDPSVCGEVQLPHSSSQTGTPPVTISADTGNKVSLTAVSRYGFDFEYDGEYARRFIFNSVEAATNKPCQTPSGCRSIHTCGVG
jgi:hypothetical protein